MFFVFAGKKQRKQIGKIPEIWKKFNLEVMTRFKKKSTKCTILKFESRSRVFWWNLGLEDYGLDYITVANSLPAMKPWQHSTMLPQLSQCRHHQACNQLETLGRAKSFLRGAQILKLCPIALNCVQHISLERAKNVPRGLRPPSPPSYGSGHHDQQSRSCVPKLSCDHFKQ